MKNTRFLLLSLVSFLSMILNVYSQNAPVTTISSVTLFPGTVITLHVTQINVVAVAGFGLRLDYDATVLSFVNPNPSQQVGNYYNTNSALYASGGDINAVQSDVVAGVTKKLVFYWSANTGVTTPATTGGTAAICDLQFRYYGGTTAIIFNNSVGGGQNCEYADANGTPYIDIPTVNYYINGSVNQAYFAIASPASICSGNSSTLSITFGNYWHWYSGSCGGTFEGTGATLVVSPTTTITYFVRSETPNNTTTCVNTTITINYPITVNFSYGYSGNNTTYQFIDSSYSTGSTITNWNWSFGDGHTSSFQHPTHQYILSGNYQVCLTVTDSLGCTDTYCDSVLVNITASNCTLYATYATVDESVAGASDGSINLTVNNGSSPYTYTWSNGATVEDISGLTSGYYNITVSDNAGCATFASVYVNTSGAVNTPIATLSNIPQDTCLQFNYDSIFVYGVYVINTTTVNVVWAFLQTSNGTIVYLSEIYTVSNAGYYTVSISITCGQKGTITYTGNIHINYNNISLAIKENNQTLNDIIIYPNPTKEWLTISNAEKGDIHIYNADCTFNIVQLNWTIFM